MTAPYALAVEHLSKSFGGFRAVHDVSFHVATGEVTALIGPNGAGKTTTFNLVNGQLTPDSGRVLVAGTDVTGRDPRALWRGGVARTFQITATFPSMTVRENVAIGVMALAPHFWSLQRPASLSGSATDALLADVGLTGMADLLAGTLAYGDLKRVELAMALANAPSLLLMDEPTAGMAAAEREALMTLAVRVCKARGAAILFTEHDMSVVFRHATRIFVMSAGELVATGTPEAIRRDPLVREVYLGKAAAP
jgi:branched-chain amino acid transport system ATP-binding protein